MFINLGIIEFMHNDAPTYERITLEFLSTVKFYLEKTGHVTHMNILVPRIFGYIMRITLCRLFNWGNASGYH